MEMDVKRRREDMAKKFNQHVRIWLIFINHALIRLYIHHTCSGMDHTDLALVVYICRRVVIFVSCVIFIYILFSTSHVERSSN